MTQLLGDITIATLKKRHYSYLCWRGGREWSKHHIVKYGFYSKTMCGASPDKGDAVMITQEAKFGDICGNCLANLRRLV